MTLKVQKFLAISCLKQGIYNLCCPREFFIDHYVVSRIWEAFQKTAMCNMCHVSLVFAVPVPQKTCIFSYRHCTTACKVVNQFFATTINHISQVNIYTRLHQGIVNAQRHVLHIPLFKYRRSACLKWCHQQRYTTENDWSCVIFTGQISFSLSADSRRKLICQSDRVIVHIVHKMSTKGILQDYQNPVALGPNVMVTKPLQTGVTVKSRQWDTKQPLFGHEVLFESIAWLQGCVLLRGCVTRDACNTFQ